MTSISSSESSENSSLSRLALFSASSPNKNGPFDLVLGSSVIENWGPLISIGFLLTSSSSSDISSSDDEAASVVVVPVGLAATGAVTGAATGAVTGADDDLMVLANSMYFSRVEVISP